jgi:diphthamide biosynthesis methyltransferase
MSMLLIIYADSNVDSIKAVKACSRVYLEAYTSILMVQRERLVGTLSFTGDFIVD